MQALPERGRDRSTHHRLFLRQLRTRLVVRRRTQSQTTGDTLMCAICGCSDSAETVITNLQTGRHVHLHDGHEHEHHHDDHHAHAHPHDVALAHDHSPAHSHSHSHSRTITVEHELLSRNNQRAEHNRGWFAGRNILALNLMSSPGAGKTT